MASTITGVRVFDGEYMTGHTTVRVVDGLIDAVGGPGLLHPGDEHVDGRGGTVLPGLIDAHVHLPSGRCFPHSTSTSQSGAEHMATSDTTITIRRDEDDEILGYLQRTNAGWQPATVFHAALAEPTSREEAENILRRDGLSCLGDTWWIEDEPGRWREARIQEARQDCLRIRWVDPLADQPAHGHWVDLRVVRVRRHRPE